MKRLIALMCAVLMMGVLFCSCNDNTAGKVKDKASEAVQDIKEDMKKSPTENKRIVDNNGTTAPTEAPDGDMMETIEDVVATEWDDMVENGEVDDGDGNVGDAENNDGDGNPAPEN